MKTSTLPPFADTADQAPTLTLHTPPENEWDYVTNLLEVRCNKQELLTKAESFIPWLEHYPRIVRTTDDGHTEEATECTAMMKTSTNKHEVARGVALIIADKQNVQAYIATLSTQMKALWRMVLTNVYVSMRTAKAILGIDYDLFKQHRDSYYYYNNYNWTRHEYKWFTATDCYDSRMDRWGYREHIKCITVSSLVRQLFFPCFFPETADDISLAELPGGDWTTVNLEADSLQNFNLFSALFQNGELPMKKKGIGSADIKRAAKKMTLKEIFPTTSRQPFHENLRTGYYLQLLAMNEHLRPAGKGKQAPPLPATYEDTLRELTAHFDRFALYLPQLLFPHVKGLRKQMTDYGREYKLATMLFSYLREEPERWTGISDLMLKLGAIESNGSSSRYNTLVYYPTDEKPASLIVNDYSGHVITAEDYTQQFGYCALQALALILCSLGMAEVALADDNHRGLSPFDTVDYLRLTPLGRYAFGVSNSYEAPEQETQAYFELDPDRLIIRSLAEPNPYAQLLSDTSQPISKNRFQTSALSFLANCHKREDVEQKISIFRRFIASDLPPLWEQFFQQLLQHCHPLKEERTPIKRYLLDPANRDLIQLITTDPQLRQLVVRAEGFRIMVAADDLKKFENQLKKHGYLL